MAAPTYVYSGNCYIATAGQTKFPLTSTSGNPIGFLEASHIKVRTSADSGTTWTALSNPTDFTLDNPPANVVLTSGAAVGLWVDIQRKTPRTTPYVDFQAGSLLTAEELNLAEKYSLYLDQEIADGDVNFDPNEGPQGPKGDQGVPGPQGPQGIQGEQGIQGPKGDGWTLQDGQYDPNSPPTCDTAGNALIDADGNVWVCDGEGTWVESGPIAGPEGPAGADGVQGIQGVPGPQGVAGATGPEGKQGQQGQQGPPGETGAQGPKGDGWTLQDGQYDPDDPPACTVAGHALIDADGDIWVCDGNGTWVESGPIAGPEGAKGDKGDKGDQGIEGPQGEQGDEGPQGIQGQQGIQGEKGEKGDKGATGASGTPGADGAPGAPGAKGDKGDQGDQGPQGEKGDKGDQGDEGPPGPAGGVSKIIAGSNVSISPTSGTGEVTINSAGGGSGGGIPEAPNDGKQYGRQSLTWTEVTSSGPGGTPNLQAVTDEGSTTTNGATFGGNVNVGQDGASTYLNCTSNGESTIYSKNAFDGQKAVFIGADKDAVYTSYIYNDGSASFAGNVETAGYLFSRNSSESSAGLYLYNNGSTASEAIVISNANSGGAWQTKLYYDGSAIFGRGNANINSDGSATFAGPVNTGSPIANADDEVGAELNSGGYVAAQRASGNSVWLGFDAASSSPTSIITSDGSATFGGDVEVKLADDEFCTIEPAGVIKLRNDYLGDSGADAVRVTGDDGDVVNIKYDGSALFGNPDANSYTKGVTISPDGGGSGTYLQVYAADAQGNVPLSIFRGDLSDTVFGVGFDGSATFAGSTQVGLLRVKDPAVNNDFIVATPDGTMYAQNTAGDVNWQFNPNGSATFAGAVEIGDYNNADPSLRQGNYLDVAGAINKKFLPGTSAGTYGFSLYNGSDHNFFVQANGSATFAGNVKNPNFDYGATDVGAFQCGAGALFVQKLSSDTSTAFGIYNGTTDLTVDIKGNGSATFGPFNDSSADGFGVTIPITANSGSVRAQCQQAASSFTQLFGAYRGTNAVFSVLADGSATAEGSIETGITGGDSTITIHQDNAGFGALIVKNGADEKVKITGAGKISFASLDIDALTELT